MQNSLGSSSSAGNQVNTKNPQAATTNNSLNAAQANLQSSQVNLFNQTNGISLSPTALPAVSLPAATAAIPKPQTKIEQHNVNFFLLGLVIAIFVVAIFIFWRMTISAKNTTD